MALEEYMLSCPTKKYLGIDCLGCGTQRALSLILEGKFVEAFYMFPAIYTVILFIMIGLLNFIDEKKIYQQLLIVLAIVNGIIMVGSYIYKHFLILILK